MGLGNIDHKNYHGFTFIEKSLSLFSVDAVADIFICNTCAWEFEMRQHGSVEQYETAMDTVHREIRTHRSYCKSDEHLGQANRESHTYGYGGSNPYRNLSLIQIMEREGDTCKRGDDCWHITCYPNFERCIYKIKKV